MKYCLKESQINPALHRIVSGPYGSEGECLGGCDQSSSSTSGSSSSSSGPCTLTSGNIQPPVVNSGLFFNPNDFTVMAFLQRSTDGGSTWESAGNTQMGADSSFNLSNIGLYRAQCASIGDGSATSSWSYGYSYPNVCNIQPPVVNSGLFFNPNDFTVMAFLQRSTDGGSTWESAGNTQMGANSSFNLSNIGLYRARCASIGAGDSVSDWSFNYNYPNPQNIQPPVVNSGLFFNPNDFTVMAFLQRSTDGGSTWESAGNTQIGANSSFNLSNIGLYRARCASIGEGDSVSAWSS